MTNLNDKKCVDFHAHPVTEVFRNAIAELGIDAIQEDGFPLPAWSVADQLRFMETAGIDFTVLSAPSPHIHNGDDEKSGIVARRINYETSEIVKANPDRFAFVGAVPLPNVYRAIVETAYVLDILGAVGLKVATNMGGVYLGDPAFDPILEEWNKRKALVIIHPCRARLRPENVITGGVAAIYEYPADTTRAVLNMIANRVMTRFPNIDWIVPHCGSFLPYMLQRFDGVTGILAALGMMETVDAKSEFERLYFDIAGDPEPTHWICCVWLQRTIISFTEPISHIRPRRSSPRRNSILTPIRNTTVYESKSTRKTRVVCSQDTATLRQNSGRRSNGFESEENDDERPALKRLITL